MSVQQAGQMQDLRNSRSGIDRCANACCIGIRRSDHAVNQARLTWNVSVFPQVSQIASTEMSSAGSVSNRLDWFGESLTGSVQSAGGSGCGCGCGAGSSGLWHTPRCCDVVASSGRVASSRRIVGGCRESLRSRGSRPAGGSTSVAQSSQMPTRGSYIRFFGEMVTFLILRHCSQYPIVRMC